MQNAVILNHFAQAYLVRQAVNTDIEHRLKNGFTERSREVIWLRESLKLLQEKNGLPVNEDGTPITQSPTQPAPAPVQPEEEIWR